MAAACSALPAWLARRGGGVRVVRRLLLRFEGQGPDPAAVLRSLCGSDTESGQALAALHVSDNPLLWEHSDAELLLSRLCALTRVQLSRCGLPCIPSQLAFLPALAELGLPGNEGLGDRIAHSLAFEPLRCLSSLRRLDLAGCRLRHIPEQLSAVSGLRELQLSGNPLVGWGDPALLRTLQCLAGALTLLRLDGCGLLCAPMALSSLQALAELDLRGNSELGDLEQVAFLPLEHLSSLSRLRLRGCPLRSLPGELSALSAVLDLDLRGQTALGRARSAAWQPLRMLGFLTRLCLAACGLAALPWQLSGLGELARLELSSNPRLGSGSGAAAGPQRRRYSHAFEPLGQLSALTSLGMAGCALGAVPPQVSALAALAQLELNGNPALGRDSSSSGGGSSGGGSSGGGSSGGGSSGGGSSGGGSSTTGGGGSAGSDSGDWKFQPLLPLRRLARLDAARCGLRRVPVLPAALRDLDVSDNPYLGQGGERAFQALLHLTALTRLGAGGCCLRSIPGPIFVLSALAHLDVSGGQPLGSGNAAALFQLRRLGALTRLEASRGWLDRLPPRCLPGVALAPAGTFLTSLSRVIDEDSDT
jgi:Leucine-rich repeat (LRR) protein